MFSYKLMCVCGFQTAEAFLGLKQLPGLLRAGFPVYLPEKGSLLTHWITFPKEKFSEKGIDPWIAAHAKEHVANEHGDIAVIVDANGSNLPTLKCPNCRSNKMKLECTGIY